MRLLHGAASGLWFLPIVWPSLAVELGCPFLGTLLLLGLLLLALLLQLPGSVLLWLARFHSREFLFPRFFLSARLEPCLTREDTPFFLLCLQLFHIPYPLLNIDFLFK